MTVGEMIERLREYPHAAELEIIEEPNGSQRRTGEKYTFSFDGETLTIAVDIEGT